MTDSKQNDGQLQKYKFFYNMLNIFPYPIFIFKKDKIVFRNKTFRDVMSFQNLNDIEFFHAISSEVLGREVKSDKDILDYFFKQNTFFYMDNVYQADHIKFGDFTLFVFVRVHINAIRDAFEKEAFFRKIIDSTFEQKKKLSKPEQASESVKENEVVTFLNDNYIDMDVKVLTFFYGLPMKCNATVIQASGENAVLKTEEKLLPAMRQGVEVTIVIDKKESTQQIVGYIDKYDMEDLMIHLHELSFKNTTAYLRKEIRLKPNPKDKLIAEIDGKMYKIYDISDNHLCVGADKTEGFEVGYGYDIMYSVKIDNKIEMLFSNAKLYSIAKLGNIHKVIFKLFNDEGKKRHKYIQQRQIELIQNIHDYIKANRKT